MDASDERVLALHRYFLQANRMRVDYYKLLQEVGASSVDDDGFSEQYIYLSLWYGCLYVVVEGWGELGLSHGSVDPLLGDDSLVALLKRFRNGAFHYQRTYWDDRFLKFVSEGERSAQWARELNSAFGRFFLEWFDAHRPR
jgi:hypothetical protein